MDNQTDADIALSKVKIRLMMDKKAVFYATILFSLKTCFTDEIPRAATDGIKLLLNASWFNALTEDERVGLVVHEVLHVALSHMTRRGKRDHANFNIAGDHVINLALLEAGFKLPAEGLWDKKYTNMSTEQVYALIHKDLPPQNYDGDVIYTKDPAVAGKVANTIMRAKLVHEQAGSPGKLPGEIGIQLKKYINPRLPWNTILANYMSEFAQDDYSMRRLNKRYMPDFYLPTLYSESLCNIAMAFDLSGSMGDEICAAYLDEADNLHQKMKPEKTTVFCFDTTVKSVQEFYPEDNIKKDIQLKGRGGTSIECVFDWINKNKPEVIIIFTDGEFYLPESYPPVSIIWLIHGNYPFRPKSGRVIRYEIPE